MRGRGFLVVAVAASLLVAGCSKSDGSDGKGKTKVTVPDKPAGLDGDEFCGRVSKDLITAAIDAPYRTYDPIPLNDFPVPGVRGYECQWEWRNPAGDVRNLKVDVLGFDGALDGALDAAWKGTVDLLGTAGKKLENVGDEAMQARLQGLVTISAREGNWQVTTVSGAKGEVSPATVDTLSLVTAAALKIGN
ncbi:hypothetical protein KSP35_19030 [Aquihabitans sp. G128]|uniref:hypothetical protein n=1 Tax=Aquihabitans sp. G128 TaxID=2849779 RepID=UPI001C2512DE|nr:hypothetical protein [Aquihabitans sp. G128]QXC60399.1 hypothetical protein KSP35_19030 [Aquihabitans sp. G128]